MQKSLLINADKCTGCLQCEMACSYEHYGIFNPSKSRIRVFDFHNTGVKVPYTCTQCDEAWCLKACPVDAISIDLVTGAKVVSEDTCVGCKSAPLLVLLARLIMYKIRVRSKSVTCVLVIPLAQPRVQLKRLLL